MKIILLFLLAGFVSGCVDTPQNSEREKYTYKLKQHFLTQTKSHDVAFITAKKTHLSFYFKDGLYRQRR